VVAPNRSRQEASDLGVYFTKHLSLKSICNGSCDSGQSALARQRQQMEELPIVGRRELSRKQEAAVKDIGD